MAKRDAFLKEQEIQVLSKKTELDGMRLRSFEISMHVDNADKQRRITYKNAQLLRHWKIDPSHLRMGESLGERKFYKTMKGEYRGSQVVIKQWCDLSPSALHVFEEECSTLIGLEHRSIVCFHGCNTTTVSPFFVTEYCSRGTLEDFMDAQGVTFGKHLLSVAYDVTCGLDCVHRHSMIHRDIKSSHVLVRDDYSAALTGFKSSVIVGTKDQYQIAGTPAFLAPEILRGEVCSERSDIYSFGVLLYELSYVLHRSFLGVDFRNNPDEKAIKVLFGEKKTNFPAKEMLQKISTGWRPNLYPSTLLLYPKYARLIKSCWSHDEHLRPSARECREQLKKIIPCKEDIGLDYTQCKADIEMIKELTKMIEKHKEWYRTKHADVFRSPFHRTTLRTAITYLPYPTRFGSVVNESVRMLEDGTIYYLLPSDISRRYKHSAKQHNFKEKRYSGYWIIRPKDGNRCTAQRFVILKKVNIGLLTAMKMNAFISREVNRVAEIQKIIRGKYRKSNNESALTNGEISYKEEYLHNEGEVSDRLLWDPFHKD
eukprot:g1433.t1